MNSNKDSQDDGFFIIPKKEFQKINEALSLILEKVSTQPGSKISQHSEYVEEKDAKEIIKKKATWFWQMRTSGKLQFSKVGHKNYYKLSDLKKILDDGYQDLA